MLLGTDCNCDIVVSQSLLLISSCSVTGPGSPSEAESVVARGVINDSQVAILCPVPHITRIQQQKPWAHCTT